MHALATLFFALPITALAGTHEPWAHRRRAQHWEKREPVTFARRGVQYKLSDNFSGQALLDNFNFFNQADPTHGLVQYVDAQTAKNEGLAVVQDDGVVKLNVDSTTQLQAGQPRKSVRLESKKTYNSGLFIGDFFAMPTGCGTWPAYWTVNGNDWPNGGELDIIEGVNLNTDNQITAHTGPTCTLSGGLINAAVGHLVSPTCTSSADNNSGCPWNPQGNATYGHNFNMQGGGVYAHLWDNTGISVWFFPRNAIPGDITSGNPDPSSWGQATAVFPNNDSCQTTKHFHDHTIVINTSLCGDWAGAAFNNGGQCSGTCDAWVADPSHFKCRCFKFL
ncbi:glycoside hydrolase family 16 protein [Irpex lacteus]|nr:glycoside hydrolase family 16 protein [Irpex lacteus]